MLHSKKPILVPSSFLFCFSYFTFVPWLFPPFWTMSDFASTDTGVKDLEFVVPGVAVGSA